jgi:hypothetical protein
VIGEVDWIRLNEDAVPEPGEIRFHFEQRSAIGLLLASRLRLRGCRSRAAQEYRQR